MNTKYFAVLLVIASATALKLPDYFSEIRKTCGEKHGYTTAQLARFKHRIDDTAASYLLCFGSTRKHLYDTGMPMEDQTATGISHAVPHSIAKATIICCNDEVTRSNATTPEKRIVLFADCFKRKIPAPLYDMIGIWGEPEYPYLNACNTE